jgi:hypothetical protein
MMRKNGENENKEHFIKQRYANWKLEDHVFEIRFLNYNSILSIYIIKINIY